MDDQLIIPLLISRVRRNPLLLNLARFSVKFILPFFTVLFLIFIRSQYLTILPSNPYLFFTLVIFFHAFIGGISSGLFTTFLATIAGMYFYEISIQSISLHDENFTRTLVFLIQAIIIATFVGQFRRTTKNLSRINKQLAYNEDKLRNIIDSMFAIITIISLDGKIIEANKNFFDIVPGNKTSITKKNLIYTLPWSYNKDVQNRLRKALRDVEIDKPIKYDDIIKIADNSFLDVEVSVVGVDEDLNGTIDLIIVSATDVSSRKLYEKEISRGKEIYKKLISSNIIGMTVGNFQGQVTEANKAFSDMIGRDIDEIHKGLDLHEIIPESYAAQKEEATKFLKTNGYYNPLELELMHNNGTKVPVMLSAVALNEERDEYLRLVVDLTSQKELERKKDEFISIASHELKTPLTTLKGYTQILQKRLTERHSENLRFTVTIDNQLNKLNELVNELLDITKIQAGKLAINKTDVNIIEIIRECLLEMDPFVSNHKLNFKPNTEVINVKADKYRISQVITNFLTNAIKYSKSDGDINLSIENKPKEVLVTVEDFGQGISKDKIEHIFEKFYQAESYNPENVEGLGLGLYISSEIIKNHGGKIGVDSLYGSGSKFYFTIPK